MENQLLAQFSDDEFVLQTQKQIAKDFGKFGYEFPLNFETSSWNKEEIESEIQEKLIEISKHGESKLLALIYTIDIAEDKFLKLTLQNDFIIRLAEEIVKREALKVYLRKHY